MYFPIYIAVFLWVFALFGMVLLVIRAIMGLKWLGKSGRGKYSVIISARNQEDTIEGLLRGFILKLGIDGQEETLFNVVLVDANSSDKTPEVMKRLAREYCFVKFIPCHEVSTYLREQWCKEE